MIETDQSPPSDLRFPELSSRSYGRLAGLGLIAGAAAFLARYGMRIREAAIREGRDRLRHAVEDLPGPPTYTLDVGRLAPAFDRGALDDAATILGRQRSSDRRGDEIDVDETLDRTLRAGLAPTLVFRAQRAPEPLVVLLDVAPAMALHRRTAGEVIDGLAARGVALERWEFSGDATVVRFEGEGAPIRLKQLARLRSEGPLLVVSDGSACCADRGSSRRRGCRCCPRGARGHGCTRPPTRPSGPPRCVKSRCRCAR